MITESPYLLSVISLCQAKPGPHPDGYRPGRIHPDPAPSPRTGFPVRILRDSAVLIISWRDKKSRKIFFHDVIIHNIAASDIRGLRTRLYKAFLFIDPNRIVIEPVYRQPDHRKPLPPAELFEEFKGPARMAPAAEALLNVQLA